KPVEIAGTFREREALTWRRSGCGWRRGNQRSHYFSSNSRFSQRTTTKSRPARFAAHGRTNENPAQGMGIRAPTERGSEIAQGTVGWGRLRGYAVHRHAASKGCLLTFRQALAMQRVRLGRCIDVATRARSAHKTAFDTNSGPLSLRRKAGAPRWLTSRP